MVDIYTQSIETFLVDTVRHVPYRYSIVDTDRHIPYRYPIVDTDTSYPHSR